MSYSRTLEYRQSWCDVNERRRLAVVLVRNSVVSDIQPRGPSLAFKDLENITSSLKAMTHI